jgi:triosephosphate isomerase
MRKPFIAGNWKMNLTPTEGKALAAELVEALKDCNNKVLVAPSFVCIPAVAEVVKGTNIKLGAQNIAAVDAGAHTGETSVLMLKDLGVDAVILGHSERRHIYGETDKMINEKVKLAIANGLEVLLCVGETIDERKAGKAEEVVNTQISEGLKDVSEADLKNVVIAYEPVWAIGTGMTATPQDAQDVHAAARKKVADLYSQAAADEMIIQYGGSVKPDNAKELMAQPDIDGGLIGGASLKTELFEPIANFDK